MFFSFFNVSFLAEYALSGSKWRNQFFNLAEYIINLKFCNCNLQYVFDGMRAKSNFIN